VMLESGQQIMEVGERAPRRQNFFRSAAQHQIQQPGDSAKSSVRLQAA
jgi:hypothetical protein